MHQASSVLRSHTKLAATKISRPFCSNATPPSAEQPRRLPTLFAGAAGGLLGGLVGIGGGAVVVPLLTHFTRMTHHQAVGTSTAAVVMTGTAGCASFGTSGAVDIVAAVAIASTAMLAAGAGAKLTSRFSGVQLARVFAVFQLSVAPLVPLKSALVKRAKATERGDAAASDSPTAVTEAISNAGAATPPARPLINLPASPTDARAVELMTLAVVGVFSGLASGLFGVGGGLVVTPALCIITDLPHTTVLGTTLASMVPSCLVSLGTHARMGNVVAAAVVPLCVGSAIGVGSGGQIAVRVPEEPLQLLFAAMMLTMGGSKLWALRGK